MSNRNKSKMSGGGMRRSAMSERPLAQPTGDPRRKAYARITVSDRNGHVIRVEKLEHSFADELTKLCDARVTELYEELGRGEVYVFINKT